MPRSMLMKAALMLALTVAMAASAPAQVREKAPKDFHGLVDAAQKAYDRGDYGDAVTNLRDATLVAANGQRQIVVDAMPDAPPGFEKMPVELDELNELSGAGFGTSITQEYEQATGDGEITVEVTANSPLVGMMSAAFGMAQLDPDLEVVTYDHHKALFRNDEGELDLQLPLHGKHHVQVSARGLDEDAFFAVFDQAAVDRLAAALGE